MNKLISQPNKELTMSSVEIAELTEKRHDNVMSDIRNMIIELELNAPDFSGTQIYGNNNSREIFNLDEELTLTLVSGYNLKMRNSIIKRWQELEQQNTPKTQAEALLGTVEILVKQEKRLEQLELEKTKQNSINDQVATQLKKLEVDTRNGVPTGFLSRSQAYRLHGGGLSKDIFEQALTSLSVESKKYIHTENDRSTQTFGWNEDQIENSIKKFINDSAQVTKTQCESQLLNGKRFRYLKAA